MTPLLFSAVQSFEPRQARQRLNYLLHFRWQNAQGWSAHRAQTCWLGKFHAQLLVGTQTFSGPQTFHPVTFRALGHWTSRVKVRCSF